MLSSVMPHPYFDIPTPTIIGHRGAAGSAPENTLPSFQRGLALGAQVLETDVHETADGVPVLLHDPNLARTTGVDGAISQMTLAEVEALDAANNALYEPPDSISYVGQGITIPTLESAFESLPNARFNIELKASSNRLIENVLALIERFDRAGRTLLAAADHALMVSMREAIAASRVRPAVGASTGDVLAIVQAAISGEPPPEGPMALQIPTDFMDQPLVTPDLVHYAQRHGIAVHVWTINEPVEMHRLLDMGIDGIVTDHPDRMRAVVEARA